MKDLLTREPVRAAIYPVLLLIVAYLVNRGIVDDETSNLIIAVAALILGAIGVETARSKVIPEATIPEIDEADLLGGDDDEI